MNNYSIDKVMGGSEARDKPEQILQSNTNAEAWNLEVERVAPQLKVDMKSIYCFIYLILSNLEIYYL